MYRARTILVAATALMSLGLAGCAAENPEQPVNDGAALADESSNQPEDEDSTEPGDEDSTPPNSEPGDTSVPPPTEVAALPETSSVTGLVLVQSTSASDCHILVFDGAELALRGTYEDTAGGANECAGARQFSADYSAHVAWDDGEVFVQRINESKEPISNGLDMMFPAIGPDGNLYAATSEPPGMAIAGELTKMTLDGEVIEPLPQAPQSVAWVSDKMIDSDDLDAVIADPAGATAVELVSINGGTFLVGALEETRPGSAWRVTGDVAETSGPGAFRPHGWIGDDRFLTMDSGTLYVNTLDIAGPSVEVEELAPLPSGYSPVNSVAKVCGDKAYVIASARDDAGAALSVLLGVEFTSGVVTAHAAIPADEQTPGLRMHARIMDCVD